MNAKTQKPEHDIAPGRRRLLKTLAVGGAAAVALPGKWVKPVIDMVIVPAHAQGSFANINGLFINQNSPLWTLNRPGALLERFADLLVGSAHAGTSSCNLNNSACIAFEINRPNVFISLLGPVPLNPAMGATQIFANNVIQDVVIDGREFSNMYASPSAIAGTVNIPNVTCSEAFLLPRGTINHCSAI